MNIPFWLLQQLAFHNMTQLNTTALPHVHYERRLERSGNIPEHLDWRDYGLVSPVRKQGLCNACWAFAAAGSIEYWLRIAHPGAEIDVQTVLDCSPKVFGCTGGLMEHVFEYEGWFDTGYAYTGRKHKCHKHKRGVHVNSYKSVNTDVESMLDFMVYKWGPVTVGVDSTTLHGYKGGVIEECGSVADHAVLVVGYTPTYWIIKNSYGLDWGEHGYMRIRRGKNTCGIDTYAAVVTSVDIR